MRWCGGGLWWRGGRGSRLAIASGSVQLLLPDRFPLLTHSSVRERERERYRGGKKETFFDLKADSIVREAVCV